MRLSLTQLRANIYQIVDEVIRTGESIEIERRGKIVKIVAVKSAQSKLSRLKKHPGTIIGDPEDLVHMDWMQLIR